MEDDLVDIYAWPKLETSDLERRRDDYRLLALESRAMSERMACDGREEDARWLAADAEQYSALILEIGEELRRRPSAEGDGVAGVTLVDALFG